MSEQFIGKAYVRTRFPNAQLQWEVGCYVVLDEYAGEELGSGKTPMEAWHDAALEIKREGEKP